MNIHHPHLPLEVEVKRNLIMQNLLSLVHTATKKSQKHWKRFIQRLSNINLVKLVEISLGLFVVMKICYWLAKDYDSQYWWVCFFLPDYFAKMSAVLLIRSYMISKEHKLFFLFWALYYGVMTLLHIVCLFDISLYNKFVSGAGYYGIGALGMTLGISWLFYRFQNKRIRKILHKLRNLFIKLRSHGRRKTKGYNIDGHG